MKERKFSSPFNSAKEKKINKSVKKIPETAEQQWYPNNNKNYVCHRRRRRRITVALSKTEKFPFSRMLVAVLDGVSAGNIMFGMFAYLTFELYVILSPFNLISSNKYRYLCTVVAASSYRIVSKSVFFSLAFGCRSHCTPTYVYYQTASAKVTEESYRGHPIPIYAESEK